MVEVVVEEIDDTVLQGHARLRSRHLGKVEVKVPMKYMIDRLKKLMVNSLV